MKAVVQERYGSPEKVLRLRKIDPPSVKKDEVLVRVRAASVHPDVWHVVTGRPWVLRLMGGGWLQPDFPVPGTDLAGEVVAVGESVERLEVGDEVFGESFREFQWRNGGTFAELVAVPEDLLAIKPAGVSFEQASTVPTSGIIALINFRTRKVEPGQRVLVNGAGGGVGTVAVQLAKAWGAHVTGVDRPEKSELLHALGADRVIDFTRQDFTRSGERYDLIFDVASNLSLAACKSSLTPTGFYVFIGHDHFGRRAGRVFGSLPRAIKLMLQSRFLDHLPSPGTRLPGKGQCMAVLQDMLAAGKLTPKVDRVFPLDQVAEALRYLALGNPRGRIVITP